MFLIVLCLLVVLGAVVPALTRWFIAVPLLTFVFGGSVWTVLLFITGEGAFSVGTLCASAIIGFMAAVMVTKE